MHPHYHDRTGDPEAEARLLRAREAEAALRHAGWREIGLLVTEIDLPSAVDDPSAQRVAAAAFRRVLPSANLRFHPAHGYVVQAVLASPDGRSTASVSREYGREGATIWSLDGDGRVVRTSWCAAEEPLPMQVWGPLDPAETPTAHLTEGDRQRARSLHEAVLRMMDLPEAGVDFEEHRGVPLLEAVAAHARRAAVLDEPLHLEVADLAALHDHLLHLGRSTAMTTFRGIAPWAVLLPVVVLIAAYGGAITMGLGVHLGAPWIGPAGARSLAVLAMPAILAGLTAVGARLQQRLVDAMDAPAMQGVVLALFLLPIGGIGWSAWTLGPWALASTVVALVAGWPLGDRLLSALDPWLRPKPTVRRVPGRDLLADAEAALDRAPIDLGGGWLGMTLSWRHLDAQRLTRPPSHLALPSPVLTALQDAGFEPLGGLVWGGPVGGWRGHRPGGRPLGVAVWVDAERTTAVEVGTLHDTPHAELWSLTEDGEVHRTVWHPGGEPVVVPPGRFGRLAHRFDGLLGRHDRHAVQHDPTRGLYATHMDAADLGDAIAMHAAGLDAATGARWVALDLDHVIALARRTLRHEDARLGIDHAVEGHTEPGWVVAGCLVVVSTAATFGRDLLETLGWPDDVAQAIAATWIQMPAAAFVLGGALGLVVHRLRRRQRLPSGVLALVPLLVLPGVAGLDGLSAGSLLLSAGCVLLGALAGGRLEGSLARVRLDQAGRREPADALLRTYGPGARPC